MIIVDKQDCPLESLTHFSLSRRKGEVGEILFLSFFIKVIYHFHNKQLYSLFNL